MVFQATIILALLGLSAWGLWQASEASVGPVFLFYLSPALISIGLVPIITYRLYALRSARYLMQRDGVQLTWGWRTEDIPMNTIEWVLPSSELSYRLRLPWLYWPGAVHRLSPCPWRKARGIPGLPLQGVGVDRRRQTASLPYHRKTRRPFYRHSRVLWRWAASRRSPHALFTRDFCSPACGKRRAARYLLLGGLLLNLVTLILVILAAPSGEQITLGFGAGREPVPAVRLLLLPVISGLFFLVDFFLGLFLFRRTESQTTAHPITGTIWMIPGRTIAYLLWSSAVVSQRFSFWRWLLFYRRVNGKYHYSYCSECCWAR